MAVDTRDLIEPGEDELQALGELLDVASTAVEPHCRVCGCTDGDACMGGCYWIEPGLCSACAVVD